VMAWCQVSNLATPAQSAREIQRHPVCGLENLIRAPFDGIQSAAPACQAAYRPKYCFDLTVDLPDPEGYVCDLVAQGQPQREQNCEPVWKAARANIPNGARLPRDCPIRALFEAMARRRGVQ